MLSFVRDGKALIRFIAYSPVPVVGFFRFDDVLQIFSLPENAPKPGWDWADHPFIIEYSFKQMDIAILRDIRTTGLSPSSDIAPDYHYDSEYNWSKQQEVLSVLSVITCYLIRREKAEHRWVLDTKGEKRTCKFAQTGYFWDGFRGLGEWFAAPDLPEIALVDSNKYYGALGGTGEPLGLSDATIPLLQKYFGLDNETREAYLDACVLFTQALEAWPISHSLTYIGIISSLEALIDFDHRYTENKPCPECGQPMYKVRQKFLAFVSNFVSSDTETKKFADRLYARRSRIGHQGKLLSDDIAGRVIPPGNEAQDSMELLYLSRFARICLVNWLLKHDEPTNVDCSN